MDPVTQRVAFASPVLRHLVGQPRDKLRQSFARLGWRATIVPRRLEIDQIHEERLERLRAADRERLGAPPIELYKPTPLKEKPPKPAHWAPSWKRTPRKPRHKHK